MGCCGGQCTWKEGRGGSTMPPWPWAIRCTRLAGTAPARTMRRCGRLMCTSSTQVSGVCGNVWCLVSSSQFISEEWYVFDETKNGVDDDKCVVTKRS